MIKALQYKNQEIPGYFIDENGKIYDANGVEQEQKLYSGCPYYFFKSHKVHVLMCHSFFGYKKGYDIHHINSIKTDNRLENLVYLTHAKHMSLHKTGKQGYWLDKKFSDEHKTKLSSAHQKKACYCFELDKIYESIQQAGRELSLRPDSIIQCCKGKQKTCGGYHFSYYS